jgi:hypothetical protein
MLVDRSRGFSRFSLTPGGCIVKKESILAILAVAMMVALASMAIAQSTTASADNDQAKPAQCPRFVDADGNGINDNAPDHDGDGIPNCQDSDWKGGMHRHGQSGHGHGNSTGKTQAKGNGNHGWGHGTGHGPRFQDKNGDGICNNFCPGTPGSST